MDKTLHKKLTEKHFYAHTATLALPDGDDWQPNLLSLLREDAKDTMQPRPQAIANILRMARGI